MSPSEPAPLGAALALAAPLVLSVCHDMAGPMATAAIGLDLADDEGAAAGEGLAIARQGLRELQARLAFLRAAFSRGQAPVATSAIEQAARGLFEGGKARLVWRGEEAELSAPTARLLLHLAGLALASLPSGGEVTLSIAPGNVSALARGRGARVSPAAALGLALAEAPSATSIDWTRAVATAWAAAALGGAVRFEAAADQVRYVAATKEPVLGRHE